MIKTDLIQEVTQTIVTTKLVEGCHVSKIANARLWICDIARDNTGVKVNFGLDKAPKVDSRYSQYLTASDLREYAQLFTAIADIMEIGI